MTALLSWHVQRFVVIWSPAAELQQGEFSIEFELWVKCCYWNGPQDPNLVITVPADVLAPASARPSAGTVLTTKLGKTFHFSFSSDNDDLKNVIVSKISSLNMADDT